MIHDYFSYRTFGGCNEDLGRVLCVLACQGLIRADKGCRRLGEGLVKA
jgi:hypothetical protein